MRYDQLERSQLACSRVCLCLVYNRFAAVPHAFGLHSLVVEDIADLEQRPKVEVCDGYLFIMLRVLEVIPGDDFDIEAEQIYQTPSEAAVR